MIEVWRQHTMQGAPQKVERRLLDDAEALALAETLAKDAELRAEEEKQRAEQAAAEIARLCEELARLRDER